MKYILFLFLSYSLFGAVNWKPYKKNTDKPVFLLLTDNPNDNLDKKIFSNERLAKLLNENFYPIKIDINKNPDFKNRYLLMTPPSIAVLDKNGRIITKKRNYTALTTERDLYNYLEALKDENLKKEMEKISHRVMYQTFFSAYFYKNPKVLLDRRKEVENFVFDKLNYEKMYFNTVFMKPLYDYCYSVLKGNFGPYEKLIAFTHLNYLLKSKIFDNDRIYKGAYNTWDKPLKKIIFKDNIKLLDLLAITGYESYFDKVRKFLESNYHKMTDEEKLLFKTVVMKHKGGKIPVELIEKNLNSKYIYNNIAVLKAYLALYKNNNEIKNQLISFENKLVKNFYDAKKGIFYDVKKGYEPFGFKYVDIIANLELSYLYTELFKITQDYNNLIIAKDILSFSDRTSVDNLIYSKYLIAMENVRDFLKESKK